MQKASKRLPQWLRDTLMFILIMGCAVAVCELLSVCYDDNNPFATSVFILAVVLVSRFTTGYWPGILASAVGVVSVNYLFTYPFHEFNLTIDGYPLTFAVMLVVSVLVSTLTTQIKRQEQLRYEAERDRMRANLLRSVSHDIRTPLTAIMGLSATVEDSETLTDEGRGMVEEIHQNAQWLLHLSENILSVTRFCDEGVEEIVGSAIRRFRKNCDTDIPITVSKPEEILLAPMDATLIEQVLLNLLENVAKHSPSATEIFIEIRAEGRRVWLTVADNGDGIPPQLLGVLFDGYLPLGAVEASDRSRHMGIGLSVCRAIVRAHGGEIYARNKIDGGAEFRFWLPAEEESNT
jgi:two-component system sensor histidine kinase KdpD